MRGGLERYYGDAAIVDTMLRSDRPLACSGHWVIRPRGMERLAPNCWSGFAKSSVSYPTEPQYRSRPGCHPDPRKKWRKRIFGINPSFPEEFAKLPLAKQVEELIFSLRDQHGYHLNQYQCVFFLPALSGDWNTAADKLAKIGYPAVPQLIHALGDRRFLPEPRDTESR